MYFCQGFNNPIKLQNNVLLSRFLQPYDDLTDLNFCSTYRFHPHIKEALLKDKNYRKHTLFTNYTHCVFNNPIKLQNNVLLSRFLQPYKTTK
jgi:hypothetical protein